MWRAAPLGWCASRCDPGPFEPPAAACGRVFLSLFKEGSLLPSFATETNWLDGKLQATGLRTLDGPGGIADNAGWTSLGGWPAGQIAEK